MVVVDVVGVGGVVGVLVVPRAEGLHTTQPDAGVVVVVGVVTLGGDVVRLSGRVLTHPVGWLSLEGGAGEGEEEGEAEAEVEVNIDMTEGFATFYVEERE